jgi:hypothetical protein
MITGTNSRRSSWAGIVSFFIRFTGTSLTELIWKSLTAIDSALLRLSDYQHLQRFQIAIADAICPADFRAVLCNALTTKARC